MALTEAGLTIPTLQEIKTQLAEDLQVELGVPLDTSEVSTVGIINAIYSAGLSNAYELLQTIYTQRTLEGAEGINLDDLVAYTNISRLGATKSRVGVVHFSGTEGTNIPQNSEVLNPSTSAKFLVESPINISATSSYKITYSVGSVLNLTGYDISVNGSSFTYTSDADATEDEILTGLESAFSGSVGYSVTKVGSTLEIVSGFFDITLNISATTLLVSDEITSLGVLTSAITGEVAAPIDSLTKISSPVSGWVSVTNPEAAIVGRDRESDEELRVRQQASLAISNKATPDAITSYLRSLSGVTTATVIENSTEFTDGDGRPKKSYEAVISGGLDTTIGQALWDSKPAGIELFGTIITSAVDIDGNSQQIKFSRPEDAYIHVEVTYTLYDEELFPVDGEDAIKAAILETAGLLSVDEDVIPKRFYGNIYSSVPGIQDLTVGMAQTPNPGDTPTGYSENTIAIGFKEIADFALGRITVVGP